MPTPSATIDLLHEQIADADTQWSLGTFGGIAEFCVTATRRSP